MNFSRKRQRVYNHAREVAQMYFEKRGYVPATLNLILNMTESDEAFLKYNPDQPRVPTGNPDGGQWTSFINTAIGFLTSHAKPNSISRYASYVANAIETGLGISRTTRPEEAKDFGSWLEPLGFSPVSQWIHGTGDLLSSGYVSGYIPLRGDVAVIQPTSHNPYGHMEMFDGEHWISDFWQAGFWPGPWYRNETPNYVIYRYGVN